MQNADAIRELVFYGRLERRKGTDVFLDALALLIQRNQTLAAQVC